MPQVQSLTFRVADSVFDLAPGYVLASLWCEGLAAPSSTAHEQLEQAEQSFLARHADVAAFMQQERVQAWRAAYHAMGVNHSTYPNAAVAIGRRVLKKRSLPRIAWAVDQCNAASLASTLPIASCALTNLGPDVVLEVRTATGEERFQPLGGGGVEHPEVGEVIYADDAGNAHSRRWNWRQGDLVKTTPDTTSLLLTVESVFPGDRDAVSEMAEELSAAFGPWCASIRSVRLGPGQREATWRS